MAKQQEWNTVLMQKDSELNARVLKALDEERSKNNHEQRFLESKEKE